MNETNSILTPTVINFIIEILKIITWPIITLCIIITFRKQLKFLLNRFSNFKIASSIVNMEIASSVSSDKENMENKKETSENENEKTSLIENKDRIENKDSLETKKNWYFRITRKRDEIDINEAEEIFKEYEREEKNPRELFKSKSLYLYYMYSEYHHEKSLSDLKTLIEKSNNIEDESNGLIWYSFALEITKQYKKISDLLCDYIKKDVPEEFLRQIVLKLIDVYILDNDIYKAKDLSLSYLSKFKERKSISELYVKLSKIEEILENDDISALLLDKAIEYHPENEDLLFKSAYQASKNDQDFISIVNYSILTRLSDKNAVALNNLAFCYEHKNLKILATDLYKKSSNLDFSLATANTGFTLLNAGFSEEAESYANKALKAKDIHPNIYNLLKSINEYKEREKKERNEIIKKSESLQKIMRKYTECYILPSNMNIEKNEWSLPDGTAIRFEKENNVYVATWQTSIEKSTSKYIHDITVEINNSSMKGTYIKFISPKPKETILGGVENKYHNIYGYYDNNELTIFSKKDEAEFKMIIKNNYNSNRINF